MAKYTMRPGEHFEDRFSVIVQAIDNKKWRWDKVFKTEEDAEKFREVAARDNPGCTVEIYKFQCIC